MKTKLTPKEVACNDMKKAKVPYYLIDKKKLILSAPKIIIIPLNN